MRRLGAGLVLGVAALTLAGLAITAVTENRTLAFTLGVQPTQVATVLRPGAEACQAPIDVAESASSVLFPVGTYGLSAPELDVTVRNAANGRQLSRRRIPGGYLYDTTVRAPISGLRKERVIALCVRNLGRSRLALYGGPQQAARTSGLELDGKPTGTDMALVFRRAEPASMASLLPEALDRASLFKAGWVTEGLLTGVGVVFLIGVPLVLALALRAALRDSPSREGLTESSAGRPARRTD